MAAPVDRTKHLTLEKRLDIIAMLEDGHSFSKIASKFGISRQSVNRVKKRKDDYLFQSKIYGLHIKRSPRQITQTSDLIVKKLIEESVKKKLHVDEQLLCELGRAAAQIIGNDDFKGSNGYIDKLKKRIEFMRINPSDECSTINDNLSK